MQQTRRAQQPGHLSSTSSGVQNLIPDVLVEIFLLCLVESGYVNVQGNSDLMSCSQVCRSWRAAALSCPRLWSRLQVQVADDSMTSQRLIPTIQCWLLRSGDASISVKIEREYGAHTTLEELDVVLAEFAQCSDRIEKGSLLFFLNMHLMMHFSLCRCVITNCTLYLWLYTGQNIIEIR